ncbi:MAG: NTP transferase domain-containing protein [Deltaproteobacteria bacterium]|nr:NTP transferase domain-containing protein [Deltaproteobacteria bacterium]
MGKPPFTAIILSAGLSSRLKDFKPLLPLGGKPILERVIALYRSAGIQDIRVVTGHRAGEVIALAGRCGVKSIFNPDFAQGMFSSVVAGVSDLSRDFAGFFIHPVDIPLVRRQTLIDLQNAFKPGNASICYPTFLEVRGHPPLISGIHVKALITGAGQGGLREFLNGYEADAMDVPVVDEFILKDIDTPEDYAWAQGCMDRRDIPSDDECRALMIRQIAPQNVIDHCRAVADLARRLATALNAAGCGLDIERIVSAARVHDLARGCPRHADKGARVLRESGFSGIADIVEVHMDYTVNKEAPITESEVVFLADKWIQEDRKVSMEERFQAKLKKYGSDSGACRDILRRRENALEAQKRIEVLLGSTIHEMS